MARLRHPGYRDDGLDVRPIPVDLDIPGFADSRLNAP
jgi:hypothetical protein